MGARAHPCPQLHLLFVISLLLLCWLAECRHVRVLLPEIVLFLSFLHCPVSLLRRTLHPKTGHRILCCQNILYQFDRLDRLHVCYGRTRPQSMVPGFYYFETRPENIVSAVSILLQDKKSCRDFIIFCSLLANDSYIQLFPSNRPRPPAVVT